MKSQQSVIQWNSQDTLNISDDTLRNRMPCIPMQIPCFCQDASLIMTLFHGPEDPRLDMHGCTVTPKLLPLGHFTCKMVPCRCLKLDLVLPLALAVPLALGGSNLWRTTFVVMYPYDLLHINTPPIRNAELPNPLLLLECVWR